MMGLLFQLLFTVGPAVAASDSGRFRKFALCEANFYSVSLGVDKDLNGATLGDCGDNITLAAPMFNDPEAPAAAIMLLETGSFGIDEWDEGKAQLGYGEKLRSFHPADLVQQNKRFHIFVDGKLRLDLYMTYYSAVSSSGSREFGSRPANCTKPAAAFLIGEPRTGVESR